MAAAVWVFWRRFIENFIGLGCGYGEHVAGPASREEAEIGR